MNGKIRILTFITEIEKHYPTLSERYLTRLCVLLH